jgi:hypothetical protein
MNVPTGFITEQAMADRLDKTLATLRRWRAHGYGPRSFKNGKTVLYRDDGDQRWLNGIEQEQPPQETPTPRLTAPQSERRYPRRGRPRKEERASA